MAAVLDWRLPDPAATEPWPLPWLPGIPDALHDHPVWSPYLAKRAELIADLAAHVRRDANEDSTPPVWATPGSQPSVALIGEVEDLAGRQRDGPERPPTHRSRTTADRGRPLATPPSTEVLRTAPTTSSRWTPEPVRLARKHRGHEDQQRMRQPLSHPPQLAARPGLVGAP